MLRSHAIEFEWCTAVSLRCLVERNPVMTACEFVTSPTSRGALLESVETNAGGVKVRLPRPDGGVIVQVALTPNSNAWTPKEVDSLALAMLLVERVMLPRFRPSRPAPKLSARTVDRLSSEGVRPFSMPRLADAVLGRRSPLILTVCCACKVCCFSGDAPCACANSDGRLSPGETCDPLNAT